MICFGGSSKAERGFVVPEMRVRFPSVNPLLNHLDLYHPLELSLEKRS